MPYKTLRVLQRPGLSIGAGAGTYIGAGAS